MKPTVFIQSNKQQILGALLSKYSLKAASSHPDEFDVRIMNLEEFPTLYLREGQTYLRKGRIAVWKNCDLQSFSPLRFLPPQLMNFEGRALVVDPDVFAIDDVFELLSSDMKGKAIMCREISKQEAMDADQIRPLKSKLEPVPTLAADRIFATSVMLLDCKKLKHWRWDEKVNSMFDKSLDYGDWIYLRSENQDIIGELCEEWNHLDTLDDSTKLIHTTRRITQPWKTGLPIDFNTTTLPIKEKSILEKVLSFGRKLIGRPQKDSNKVSHQGYTTYQPHPDPNQERLIMGLIRGAIQDGIVTRDFILNEIRHKNVREDIFKVLGEGS